MKPQLRKHLLTCALLAGLGAAAHAQTPPPGGPGAGGPQAQGRHFDPARMAQRIEQRLADLKQKLQINASQEAAWSSFATAMRPGTPLQRPDREAIARMSTPDRIDHMRALRDRRNAEMDRRADATKAFYAQLTAEQKKTFDTETARRFGGPGGAGPGGPGRQGHHHG